MRRSPSIPEMCSALSLAQLEVLREGLGLLVRAHAGLEELQRREPELYGRADASVFVIADDAPWLTPLANDLRGRRAALRQSTVLAKQALTTSVPAIENVLHDVCSAHPAGQTRPMSLRLAREPAIGPDPTDPDATLAAIVQVVAWHRHVAEDLFTELRRAVALLDDAQWPRSAAAVVAASGVASLRDRLHEIGEAW